MTPDKPILATAILTDPDGTERIESRVFPFAEFCRWYDVTPRQVRRWTATGPVLRNVAIALIGVATLAWLFTHLPGCSPTEVNTINGTRPVGCGPAGRFNTTANGIR